MGIQKEIATKKRELCEVCKSDIDRPSRCKDCRMRILIRDKEVTLIPATGVFIIDKE